jgi:hypothetical protein
VSPQDGEGIVKVATWLLGGYATARTLYVWSDADGADDADGSGFFIVFFSFIAWPIIWGCAALVGIFYLLYCAVAMRAPWHPSNKS